MKIAVHNDRSTTISIMVEMAADLFRLRADERLEMSFDPNDQPIEIEIQEDGIRIFPNSDYQPDFTIDGKDAANRSWSD